MRSVSAWRVDSAQEARTLLPCRDEDRSAPGGCLRLGPVGEIGVVERPEATYVDLDVPDADAWCTAATYDAPGARELVGHRAVLDSGSWLVVEEEQPLIDVPIGCTRWSVVFCDNPWVVARLRRGAPADQRPSDRVGRARAAGASSRHRSPR